MPNRLFVGRIPDDAREGELADFFKPYGEVTDVSVKRGFGFVQFSDERDAEEALRALNGAEFLGRQINVEFTKTDRRSRYDDDRRHDDRRHDDRRDDRRYDDRRHDDRRYDDRRYDDRRHDDRRYDDHYDRRDRYRDDYRDRRDRRRSRSPRERRFERPRSTKHRLMIENLPSGVNWQDIKDYFRTAGNVTYADVDRQDPHKAVVDFATESDMKTALETLNGKDFNGSRIHLQEAYGHGSGSGRENENGNSRSYDRDRSRSPAAPEKDDRMEEEPRSREMSPPNAGW